MREWDLGGALPVVFCEPSAPGVWLKTVVDKDDDEGVAAYSQPCRGVPMIYKYYNSFDPFDLKFDRLFYLKNLYKYSQT